MNSTKISIAMAAILFAAAFAGIMMIDDDADAAGETVSYKVTYVYGDNIKVETAAANATLCQNPKTHSIVF